MTVQTSRENLGRFFEWSRKSCETQRSAEELEILREEQIAGITQQATEPNRTGDDRCLQEAGTVQG